MKSFRKHKMSDSDVYIEQKKKKNIDNLDNLDYLGIKCTSTTCTHNKINDKIIIK